VKLPDPCPKCGGVIITDIDVPEYLRKNRIGFRFRKYKEFKFRMAVATVFIKLAAWCCLGEFEYSDPFEEWVCRQLDEPAEGGEECHT
jgi:hypothetical protein